MKRKEPHRGQNEKELDGVITVKIKTEEIKILDKYAKKMKITRSQLVRNMIETGLDDLQLMNSTGLLTMALKGIDLLGMIRNSIQHDKYQVEDGKVTIEL